VDGRVLGIPGWLRIFGKPGRRDPAARFACRPGVAVLGFWFCYHVMYDWGGRSGATGVSPATKLTQVAVQPAMEIGRR
jgi:hypothetical protein